MKRSRFSEEQIIGVLKEQEAGMPTVEVPAYSQCAGFRQSNAVITLDYPRSAA